MSRRRYLIAGGTAVVLAASAGFVLRGGDGAGAGTSTAAGAVKTRTAKVVKTTLIETEELSGSLGYGDERTVAGSGAGVITRLPEEGTVVENGENLYEVNGRNVALLYGNRPAWRALAENVPDGADVAQLEEALVDLGFANRREISVDQHFGAPTTAAVKRFQKAAGLDQDGVLDQGEIVFLSGAVRVAEHQSSVGSPAGGAVMKVTSAARTITTSVDADDQDKVHEGQEVQIELPDGKRVPGKVTSISTVAKSSDSGMGGGGSPTVEVIVTPDDPASTGRLDGAPVTLHFTAGKADDVLAVPVAALLALSEGGFAVEVEDSSGKTRLVGVETGMFSDGQVEVIGDGLRAGQSVVVPA